MKIDNRITRIVKRDGSIVPFDQERITNAIYKAAASVGGHNRALSEQLSDQVVLRLNQCFQPPDMPTVEEIQDMVEKVLIENGHAKTARAYIVYREYRRKEREKKSLRREHFSPLPYRLMYENLLWNIDHDCETIEKLNGHIRQGTFVDLVREADEAYNESLRRAAEIISSDERIRLIIVAGPSSSGKTTTTAKLALLLKEFGVETVPLNLDHYFFDLELHPRDEFGDYDFETPEALDINLINQHLGELVKGKKIKIPHYDFKTGKRTLDVAEVSIKPNQVILIDTLHGLYEPMTSSVDEESKFKLYIETVLIMRDSKQNFIRWTDIRLLRRMVRDHSTRGYDPLQTLTHWHYVRRSELKHIIPFVRNADYVLNGALPYELPYHKKYSFKYFERFVEKLKDDPKRNDAWIRAERIHALLQQVTLYEDETIIAPDSLLREFIGGSIYKLH
ncbi:MAG: ATP cone domain-containing protein [bacterium]